MKFNKQELSNLACQSSNRFIKEGALVVYEKQDGVIFKRNEIATERWCRLRGNMLFYFKSSEAWSEPAGVIILDIGNIHVDPVPFDGTWPFTLVMESGGGDQRLAACSEGERDSWIEVLHRASYSYIRAQVTSLQMQLKKLQVVPTLTLNNPEVGEVPLMELAIACDNLRCDGHGWPPSPQAVLHYLVPQSFQWQQVGQTESVEDCSNPIFLVTLPLWCSMGMQHDTKLRLTVTDVKEAMSRTHIMIGASEFTLSSLLQDGTLKRRLPLISSSGNQVGFVTVAGHTVIDLGDALRNSSNPQSPQEENLVLHQHRRTQSLPPKLLTELRRPSQGWISVYFTQSISRSYRFHSGLGGDIVVHESMMESRLNNIVPAQLLKLWINQEKDLVRELVALGEMMASPWQQRLLQLFERHFRRIGDYTQALESVEGATSFFRPSSQKDKSTLQYCPVNLHLQRFWGQNSSLRKEGTYDCLTVGAFTAIPHGFKGGGLLKLLRNFHTSAMQIDHVLPAREAVQTACQTLRHIQGAVKLLLGAGAIQQDFSAILKIVESLIKRVRSLTILLDAPFVGNALSFFEKNKLSNATVSPTLADFSLLPLRSMAERLVLDTSSSRKTFYSASDEPEPTDLIRVNLEASLLALAGKLQILLKLQPKMSNNNSQLEQAPGLASLLDKYEGRLYTDSVDSVNKNVENQNDSTMDSANTEKSNQKWCTELSPCLSKLLSAAQALIKTLRLVHGVQRLQEELPRSATAHSIQHRRDVCFSQALTAALTILVARLCCNPVDPELMVLLSNAGLLLNVEGLLTPYRTEAGMWSDMAVALEDLAAVRFLLIPASATSSTTNNPSPNSTKQATSIPKEYLPQIHGCRDALQVMIPVPPTVFSALPSSASRLGLIEFQLIPVFFNIGVNEQALMADKFGDMSAVNATNLQSFERLDIYYKRYQKLITEHFPGKRLNDPRLPLPSILSQLQIELASNKIQNIAVHTLAEILVRKMKGLRVTCCKSAKDRTGMAVTLEQTNILTNDFDLATAEFHKSLLCMRSQGTRRENTRKNVGVNKFAFNRLQLMAFPELYRPPPGTYGNVQS
ncbi:inositol polyphosphate-4-phosphatase type I A-like isoform X2 [Daphnia pulicaria]|uniref:inositol polyphosphate-4-phosphatase type I A-like isoform X2 n=1 Tax=Daphnia pulicaria TaxID=35523 RepID=UPI001EEB2A2A|nr:inositol polyphosphate-4-phosphatase type I A-like isoform X2 [Daphnia pulicaria]